MGIKTIKKYPRDTSQMPLTPPVEKAKSATFRDIPIDVIRGLALTLMIMANMSPALLAHPAPGWYRFLATLAAPAFILVAGMLVALSRTGKKRTLGYMATRAGLTILVAVMVDLFIFHYAPFLNIDVLYLIGIGLLAAWLYLGLPGRWRWIIIAGILCLTPVLQVAWGYQEVVVQYPVFGNPPSPAPFPGVADIVKSWLIDGWFPVFPWLAFSLLGAELGMYRWKEKEVRVFPLRTVGLYAAGLLGAGAILWALFPGPQYIMLGFVELFYPPVPGLLIFCIGFFLVILAHLDHLPQIAWMDPLRAMGECSLAVYILHEAVISQVIGPLGMQLPVPEYLVVYLILLAGMILVAYGLRALRKSWPDQPYLVRFLIGG
jgi:uncharacterized membrane protein